MLTLSDLAVFPRGRRVEQTLRDVKNVTKISEIGEFLHYIWIHHEKCITQAQSTNILSVGFVIHEMDVGI